MGFTSFSRLPGIHGRGSDLRREAPAPAVPFLPVPLKPEGSVPCALAAKHPRVPLTCLFSQNPLED